MEFLGVAHESAHNPGPDITHDAAALQRRGPPEKGYPAPGRGRRMRPRSAAAFAWLTLLLLSPVALADQDVSAGDAHAWSQNASTGDGCDGANGGERRHAEARVNVTDNETVFVFAHQSCSAWNNTWDDGHGNTGWSRGTSDQGFVQAGRSSRGNWGPIVQLAYHDMREESSWGRHEMCSTTAYASGPVVYLGCFPDGGRWPMAPLLP